MFKTIKILLILFCCSKLHAGDDYVPNQQTEEFREKALGYFFTGKIIDFFEQESKTDHRLKVISRTSPEDRNVCHTYSSIKIFNENLIRDLRNSTLSCGQEMSRIISERFEEVDDPQPGDLVAYYNHNLGLNESLTHTGIYRGNGLVESKWGDVKAIFLHPKLYSMKHWGDKIRYYRQKNK